MAPGWSLPAKHDRPATYHPLLILQASVCKPLFGVGKDNQVLPGTTKDPSFIFSAADLLAAEDGTSGSERKDNSLFTEMQSSGLGRLFCW